MRCNRFSNNRLEIYANTTQDPNVLQTKVTIGDVSKLQKQSKIALALVADPIDPPHFVRTNIKLPPKRW